MEDGQQHCAVREIGETGSNPFRSEQQSAKLLRSHRLSSRGAYLWQTPSRGRFTTLSDGGRLFLHLFSNDRLGRAAHVQPNFSECEPLSGILNTVHNLMSLILSTFDAYSETLQMVVFWDV